MTPAFGPGWAGPKDAQLVFVAEAWGASEAELGGQPLVGESGKEFWRMLGESIANAGVAPELHHAAQEMHKYGLAWVRNRRDWLDAAGIAFTNVFNLRPDRNDLETLCVPRSELPHDYPKLPALARGKYLRPEYLPETQRLYAELSRCRPNLVVALGNAACWALLRTTGIGSIRGTITAGVPEPIAGIKVLPTYHPAGVLRNWSWRPIVVADLIKSWGESQFPEIRRPARRVLVDPTLEECRQWTRQTIGSTGETIGKYLACDIETGNGQIKCVGFARSRNDALVIPFVDLSRGGGSYWSTSAEERAAWECVRDLLESGIGLVFQNGVYDLQYLMKLGLRPANVAEDTMLLHHSLFPELQKGLGFLGSIYTSEPAWKLMRRVRPDTEKRDE